MSNSTNRGFKSRKQQERFTEPTRGASKPLADLLPEVEEFPDMASMMRSQKRASRQELFTPDTSILPEGSIGDFAIEIDFDLGENSI